MPPLEIQVFTPVRRLPRAVVAIAATSDPASGSDSANAAIFSPAATAGR